jgi:ribosomal-protein-alanine N-acetyltransferase
MEKTTLTTPRLTLRPYETADGDAVWPVASHPLIYATTLGIPRDYPRENVDWWFGNIARQWEEDAAYEFGLFAREDGRYVGNCALISVDRKNETAVMAYFIDPSQWRRGYATESARAVCAFGFDQLGLRRINGECYSINPASRRVMEKVGFAYEGTRRAFYKKDGVCHDIDQLGLLPDDLCRI